MALIKCQECGHDVSSEASQCSNCGYPETKQGLSALRQIPTTGEIPKKWRRGGYVFKEESFFDPWGNKLIYKSPGRYSDYDIISYGADGRPGGNNENADIKISVP